MKALTPQINRRNFIRTTATITTGLVGLSGLTQTAEANISTENKSLYFIGPMEGYSPQIGTLVSMMNYMRDSVINSVKKLSKAELDHLYDANSNSIGSLILHLGATEKFYQINTFEGRQEFNDAETKMWGAPMSLGDEGRKVIKGQEVKYYLDAITEVRAKTLQEFKNKDDQWLMALDPAWSKPGADLNTYWKWFHVCEHESNHRGQIKWLMSRLPGAKPSKD